MKNQPYVKKFDENKNLLNPITKDAPYLHKHSAVRHQNRAFKYIVVTHPVTREFIGTVKRGGNNRAKTKRTGNRRNIHFA